jgi:glycosyltransferase involved in cell wall biosynthesis
MYLSSKEKTKTRLTVAMISCGFPPQPVGGCEIQCLRLSKKLIEKGIDIYVLTNGTPELERSCVLSGVPVYRMYSRLAYPPRYLTVLFKKIFPSKRKGHDCKTTGDFTTTNTDKTGEEKDGTPKQQFIKLLPLFWYYFRFLWRERKKIQIIHVHNISNYFGFVFALLGKILGKKVVIKDSTMNGILEIGKHLFGRIMQKVIVSNCYVVAISKVIENNFRKIGIRENQIFRVPNGIEIPHLPHRRTNSNTKCFFAGNPHRDVKGVDILLQSWKTITSEVPGSRLYIAGGPVNQKLRDYISERGIDGSVTLAGQVENVREYLLNSNVFVLPSRREGMSNSLIEAMAYGLACVATDISGSEDLIENNINGILVPVDNVEELTKAIIYLLKNPEKARKMGMRARNTIVRRCDINYIADQYINIYKTILSGN